MNPKRIYPKKKRKSGLSLFCFFNGTKNSAGFTIVELLLVLAIFAAATGLVYPNLKQFYLTSRYQNTARQLIQLIEYGRVRAFSEMEFLRLKIDITDHQYSLEIFDREDDFRPEFKPLTGRWGKVYKLPNQVMFESGTEREIYFRPDGSAEKFKILLSLDRKDRLTIQSNNYFGKPFIES